MKFDLTKTEAPTEILKILTEFLEGGDAIMLHTKEGNVTPLVVLDVVRFYALLDAAGFKNIPIQYFPIAGEA
jgi:hypothetical protein